MSLPAPQPVASSFCPTRVLMGVDAHRALPAVLHDLQAKRLFVALDPALRDGEFFASVTALLDAGAIAAVIFDAIEPEPADTTVVKAWAVCRDHGADAILAIGGGSTLDVAKAVGILMANGGCIADYEGVSRFTVPPLPLIAVPSTAGTGSEVSGACVVTDSERHVKMAIRHAAYCPARVAILDPLAVRSVPAQVAAHAGIDAFVHAFESYLSKLANPFSDALNLQAMRLIAGSLRQFVANRANTAAALDMLCGSSMAAMSFGVTGLGNVHCMAMAVGACHPVPHGLANAVCLPYAAAFNFNANPARFAQVAAILGARVDGVPELTAGRLALEAIGELCRDLAIPPRLRDVGVAEASLPELARRAFAADYNRWNPRYTSQADFEALFRAAY